ncbi:GntR family transcriptional regulator [Microvirga pudoricolor]|uniref:GntR family transcriptional regulator n=1 Tax=Microvirga pudoricolor TaxID=2778729 RepID=UPI00194FCF0E|nr:GntR family transcriptional regulator [Microvirga pudoricolor]MBM6593149.1 GntR family transcriptional regulator [Microvirga pudoricolor]
MAESERVVPVHPIFLANLRDHVHHNLRDAIVAGRFQDGERLSERDLARELGVSTTPLKEALRQLESEGLVRTEARRGVYVTFGAQQAEEMSLARAALESMIARLAAKRAEPSDVERLRDLVRRMEGATAAGDITLLIDLNEAFHGHIHEASGCDYLCRLQAKQQMYNHTIRVGLLGEAEERGLALGEHRAIAEAIATGDQDAAERIMRDHVVRSGQRHVQTVFGATRLGDTI